MLGYGYRNAIRQQIQLRVEASAIFPNVFQSQYRCIPPTKSFSGSTGYGCFTYIPLLWYEEGRLQSEETFNHYNTIYYSRPSKIIL